METTDLAIKYRALYQKTELMVSSIKEIGFDVSEYERILKDISTDVKDKVKVSYDKGYASANYKMDYSNGIAELNKLISHLDKYDVYFKVLNSCEWLNIKMADKNITKDELNQCVSEMTYDLKQIVKSDTMDYDNEKHIVEMVYEVAYKLIKLELMMTGNSKLYAYIKREDINISYFNIIIKKELGNLEKTSKDNTFLREKLLRIRKNGINSDYFDLDLIKALLVYDGNNSFRDTINQNMEELVDKINKNAKEIDTITKKANDDKSNRKWYHDHMKEDKKGVFIRFISFLTATSIIAGAGFGVQRLSKKLATGDKYLKTTEIYSTITDDTTTETREVFFGYTPSDDVNVRVYGPYISNYRREYQDYDVSHLDFDSAREYYEYGVDNYGVVPEEVVLDNRSVIPDYQNSYTEVTKETYEYQGVGFNEEGYTFGLWLGYILYIVVLLVIESAVCTMEDYTIILGTIVNLIDEIKALLEDKEKYKKYSNELIEKTNKLMKLINQNEVLRNEFNRLYEANRYLLDNPEELYKKIDEIDYSDAKKLVKENKNKR